MAYETGSSSSMADLLTKLFTFATANGWTSDQQDTTARQFAMHKNSVYVSFAYASSPRNHLAIYQALGYTGGNRPGTHPDDSGNGFNTSADPVDTSIDNERCVLRLTDGPHNYYFFENNASPAYIHVVVETNVAGVYRHFGFGEIVKFQGSDWTGGEYCYGEYYDSTTPPVRTDTCLLDGANNAGNTTLVDGLRGATLHVEGLPGEAGASKWGNVNGADASQLNDTAGNAREAIVGGYRGSMSARIFGFFSAGNTTGLIPMTPIDAWHLERTPKELRLLGTMADVRGINMKFFAAAQEVTIGADTWLVFPLSKKTSVSSNDRSYNSGIAYKKVTA